MTYLKLYSFTCNYIQKAYFWKKTGVFTEKPVWKVLPCIVSTIEKHTGFIKRSERFWNILFGGVEYNNDIANVRRLKNTNQSLKVTR